MKRTIIALTLAVVMIMPLLAGCAGPGASGTTAPGSATAAPGSATAAPAPTSASGASGTNGFDGAADTFPIVDSPVTFSILALRARVEIEDWATNKVTQYWQDKTGVNFEWDTVIDAEASKQKLSVVMASGSLPDIIISASGSLSVDQAVAYGGQRLLVPMNDMIDKYGVNLNKLFEMDAMVEPSITAPDGNIYFLPSYTSNAQAHTSLMQRAMINTTWLDNLNLQMPTTTDEYYEVLKAFKTQDANANGDVNDEIPLVTLTGNYTGFDIFIMHSFLYNSGKLYNWLSVEDGNITAAYAEDGWREGLKYMRTLYSEGLADKEIFLTTSDQLKMYTADANGNRVGSALTYSYSSFMNLTSDVVKEFDFIPPLTGPTGIRQTSYIESWIDASFFITSACKEPEIAFRVGDALLFDALSDPSLEALNGVYGPEGEGWERAAEGELGFDGVTPATYKWIFVFGQPNNLNWHEWGPLVRRSDWKLQMSASPTDWDQETLLYHAAMDLYKPYAVAKTVPSTLMFETEKVSQVSQLKETLNSYVSESMSKFVTGSMSLENDWDAYLNELEKIGLETYLNLYQEAYDRQFGN
ncbi:MAG: hypothetical protein ACOX8S_08980 [Christensenellales bacterium]|jgi:putative aldouronate transport system substrate-binding protein